MNTLRKYINSMINGSDCAAINYNEFVDLMININCEYHWGLTNLGNIANCIKEYFGIDLYKFEQFKCYINCHYYNTVANFKKQD